MQRNKCFFILLVSVFFTSNSCSKFKDNDHLSLLTVKKRLIRHWALKEAILVDRNLDLMKAYPYLSQDELNFGYAADEKVLGTKNLHNVTLSTKAIMQPANCVLKDRNRKIYLENAPDWYVYYLTITKLTTKELWLEGNPIWRICARDTLTEFLKLKYEAKD